MNDLAREAAAMSDADLEAAVAAIRGTSKRGIRRRLTEAEALALGALLGEQERRRLGSLIRAQLPPRGNVVAGMPTYMRREQERTNAAHDALDTLTSRAAVSQARPE